MATKNIDPNLRLISDYLTLKGNERFRIPEYQRGYSWYIVQCDKLWQDIETFIDSNAEDPYFFGTVIIDCSMDGYLNLIDGQQRTTTFLLLMKAMYFRIKNALKQLKRDDATEALEEGLKESRNKILSILYKADVDKRVEILSDWNKARGISIMDNQSINELYKNDISIIIDSETYEEAEARVKKIPRKQKDNKYTNFFRNFKFFYEKLESYSESQLNKFAKIFLTRCQVIEIKSWQIEQAITMFNSLNSTGMPLSDADIISAQLYSKAKDKDAFSERWQGINKLSNSLGSLKVVNIDSVLQQFMYINRAVNKQYKENELSTPGVRKYYTIDCPDLLEKPLELCDSFDKILAIWDKIKSYPIIKLLLKFNENFKLFLISYLNRYDLEQIDEKLVTPIAICLLRLFAIIEVGDLGYSASAFKTFLFNENFKLVDDSYDIDEIISDFNSHINHTWKVKDVEEDIMEYDKNILVFLNEYLYMTESGMPFDFKENVNVEHIMPASGHNIETIRTDANIETREEFDELANLLGNKILLEEDINKSISNDWFKTKISRSVKEKKGYLDSNFGLAKKIAESGLTSWAKEEIIVSTKESANRILSFVFNSEGEN